MATIDLSSIEFFLPLLSFIIVFVICFVLFTRANLNVWVAAFISFIVGIIFVSAIGPRDFILSVIPWFAIIIVLMFMVLALTGFLGKDMAGMNKGIGITFLVLLGIAFVVSAFFIFSVYFEPYLPGSSGEGGNPTGLRFTDWLYSPSVSGAILLLVIALIVGWFLVKAK